MSDTPSKAIPLTVVGESLVPGEKQVAGDKIARSPVQFADAPVLRKPSWIRVRIPSGNSVQQLKSKLRENRLVTVCEEASCPNIHECFSHGTATFMILGEVCTRRCSFCDVAHGRPKPPDPSEPLSLATTGRPTTFIAAALVIVLWAVSGPLFGFSDTWQLVINTGTTIITFLMVALIQNTQTRADQAVQHKLNAVADALADLMEHLDESTDTRDLMLDRSELKKAVGLESHESTTHNAARAQAKAKAKATESAVSR